MLEREKIGETVRKSLRQFAVTALYGPRQCGKTTLARMLVKPDSPNYFDLEDPVSARRLAEPMTALRGLRGLVVIDEVQRQPNLFPVLRVLADRRPRPARFLILGSASPELLRQGSESLAGRIALVEMTGFQAGEVPEREWRRLWWRGGFPGSYLARNDGAARHWQENFIRTFLERDIREFGTQIAAAKLRRLWTMIAHYHGGIGNASEIGRSLGGAHTTIKRHLDLLSGALMIRQLPPWHENLAKRQVKTPKLYVRDSGLLHALLDVPSFRALEGHPKIGASWEGFVIEEILRVTGDRQAYFWSTQSGAELDLLLGHGGRRVGVEVKYQDAPGFTKSMRIAREDLGLERMYVVYPGERAYALEEGVEVLPLADLLSRLRREGGRAKAAG